MKVFLAVTALLISCEEKLNYIPSKPQQVRLTSNSNEVKLPTRLFEELEDVYLPPALDQSAVQDGDHKTKLEIPKDFFSFHVYLKEKTSGVLKNPNGYDLIFPTGGGLLDFADYLTDRRGSFYLGFRPELELKKDDVMKVFYLSHSKIVNIDGEVHGSGCDKYMDVTQFFADKMAKEGIFINTSDGRHVALMAGHYFFAVSIKGKLYLSQLTIRDSRFKKQHCTWK